MAAGALLFDLYDTLVTMDADALRAGRLRGAELAGVDPECLGARWSATVGDRSAGRLGPPRDELLQLLAGCGAAEPTGEALDALLQHERTIWQANARLYADTLPMLAALRRAACPIAIVSNCSWQTGGVVDATRVRHAVDATILSFEAGTMKPDPAILRLALERLGADPAQSVLVDDVEVNLDAARDLGLATVLMDRRGTVEGTPAHPVARDLEEAAATPGWRRCLHSSRDG